MTVARTKTFKAAEQGQISKVNEELLETRKTAVRSVSKPFGRSFELVWLLMLFQFKTKKIVSFRLTFKAITIWANPKVMQQSSQCASYANNYRDIYQMRLLENGYQALNESVLRSAASATKLSEFAEVWARIGADCVGSTASEELRNKHPHHARLREMPLKDMMKSMVIETSCRCWTGPPESFTRLLKTLFQTAEIREQQLILLVLPLLKSKERFLHIATEATRTNIVPVFSSLALQNPFPQDHFTEHQWNQMVLKAIFVGCAITEIEGLQSRHNEALSETIFQYVRERHSAYRTVPSAVVELCEKALSEPSQLRLNAIKSDLRLE